MWGEAGTVLYRGMCGERRGWSYIEACVGRGGDGLIKRHVLGEAWTSLYRGMCAERCTERIEALIFRNWVHFKQIYE